MRKPAREQGRTLKLNVTPSLTVGLLHKDKTAEIDELIKYGDWKEH